MINIVYDGDFGITATGHAGQAPMGQDLVCCAVSTLITSLAEYLKQSEKNLAVLKISLENGLGYIKAVPTYSWSMCCDGAFSMTVSSLEWLAEAYPDYITFNGCGNIMVSPT